LIQTLRHKTSFGLALVREGRIGPFLEALRVLVWSETRGYGLKRDLTVPFAAPVATIPIRVRPATERDIQIMFNVTDPDVPESERADRRDRAIFFRTGVRTCYVAVDDHDTPCFFQAALIAEENAFIQRAWKGSFPSLAPRQVLLENAFTPEAFRGRKIMPAAMARIAEACASDSVSEAITFVDTDNIPSLKGCVRSGFHPYCFRLVTRRFFRQSTVFTPLPADTTIPGVTDR
jgi:hypothetical protein